MMKSRLRHRVALGALVTTLLAGAFAQTSPASKSGIKITWPVDKGGSPNDALIRFLGNPIPPPADLEPEYTPEALQSAFSAACKKLRIRVRKVAVDDSEFPFVVYGAMEGDFRELQKEFSGAYTYSGAHTERRGDVTYFAVNLIPWKLYSGTQASVRCRIMVRSSMLLAQTVESSR